MTFLHKARRSAASQVLIGAALGAMLAMAGVPVLQVLAIAAALCGAAALIWVAWKFREKLAMPAAILFVIVLLGVHGAVT